MLLQTITLGWLAACAAWDWRTGRVPNWLTLPAVAVAAVVAVGKGPERAALFAGVGIALLVAWSLGAMGGADAKVLLALAGLWPVGFVGASLALAGWVALRRVAGRGGPYRAAPVIAAGVVGAWALTAVLSQWPMWSPVEGIRLFLMNGGMA
jgi:hypothetical protein